MEVRITAKICDTEVGVGVLLLDTSKLLQVLQSQNIMTPSSISGPVSHLFSPQSIPQVPLSIDISEVKQDDYEDDVQVVPALTLPTLTPSMSSIVTENIQMEF